MKAYQRLRYGAPDTLELREVPTPDPTEGQVRVRVHAAGVNALDWHVIRGLPHLVKLSDGLTRPRDPGCGMDVAGTVEAIGANVTALRPGDRVLGCRLGAFAEVVCGRNFVAMPEGLTFEQAAAIPTAGLTALQGLRDHGRVGEGTRVLINGAGGGVGSAAVQLAVTLGAQVTALTRPATMDMVRSLGAARVVDHTQLPADAETGAHDLVLDAGGNLSIARMRRMVVPGGRVVLAAAKAGNWIAPIGRIAGAMLTSWFSRRRAISFLAKVNTDDLTELAALAGRGRWVPHIEECYPFERTPEAINRLQSGGVRGKLVIRIR